MWASHSSKDENNELTKHTARGIFPGKHNLIQEAITAMLQPNTTMATGHSTLAPPRFAQKPLSGTARVLVPSVIFCIALFLSACSLFLQPFVVVIGSV